MAASVDTGPGVTYFRKVLGSNPGTGTTSKYFSLFCFLFFCFFQLTHTAFRTLSAMLKEKEKRKA